MAPTGYFIAFSGKVSRQPGRESTMSLSNTLRVEASPANLQTAPSAQLKPCNCRARTSLLHGADLMHHKLAAIKAAIVGKFTTSLLPRRGTQAQVVTYFLYANSCLARAIGLSLESLQWSLRFLRSPTALLELFLAKLSIYAGTFQRFAESLPASHQASNVSEYAHRWPQAIERSCSSSASRNRLQRWLPSPLG